MIKYVEKTYKQKVYYCNLEGCDNFETAKLFDFNRHLCSKKHIRNSEKYIKNQDG